MSHVHFSETQSTDPVEQAIAHKVMAILNDVSLDRVQREAQVKQAQRELIRHRRQRHAQQALRTQVSQTQMPKGYQAKCVTVREGVIHVGAVHKRHSFIWIDVGPAPQGVAANQAAFAVQPNNVKGKAAKGTQRVRKDPIAERRKAMESHRI